MNNSTNKLILPTLILATFLGMLGAHRFYAGKIGTGIVMLLLTASFLGIVISAVWLLVDWIAIVCGGFTDGEGKKISEWI